MSIVAKSPAPPASDSERDVAPLSFVSPPDVHPASTILQFTVLRRVAVVAALAVMVAVYVVHTSLPSNPMSPSDKQHNLLRVFIPEGWGFFTLSPRKPLPEPLRRSDDGNWRSADAGHLAEIGDGFGVNRIRRAQGTEIALILKPVPPEAWIPCGSTPAQCLSSAPVQEAVRNGAARPSLCGDIGLVVQDPVPWAWRHSAHKTVMPSSVVRLEVRC